MYIQLRGLLGCAGRLGITLSYMLGASGMHYTING